MPMRKMNLRRRVAKKQRGSGFSFGVDQPQIAGQPEVVTYSDCGSVNVPKPMDHSVGNVVQGCAANGAQAAQNQPAANAVQAALNSGAQAGGKRRRRNKRNKSNKKQKKRRGNKSRSKKSKSKSKSKSKRSKKSRK